MYRALELAKYIIARCNQKKNPITNLQLQKILYYVQGYFFKNFKAPAFPEEICKWPYGPVIPDVYYEYNQYGGRKITDGDNALSPNKIIPNYAHRACIDEVADACLNLTPGGLVEKTHQETPWRETAEKQVISSDLIQDYFHTDDPFQLSKK